MRYTISLLAVLLTYNDLASAWKSPRGSCNTNRLQTALFGKGKIQRVGRSEADIANPEEAPWMQAELEEMEPEPLPDVPDFPLQQLLLPPAECDPTQLSPVSLAYVGDSVYELFVRCRKVWPQRRSSDLQDQVVSLVCARHQSKLLEKLNEVFDLTTAEKSLLVRSRNSAGRVARNKDPKAYGDSTALEALIGFLYMTDKARCQKLMNWIAVYVERIPVDYV